MEVIRKILKDVLIVVFIVTAIRLLHYFFNEQAEHLVEAAYYSFNTLPVQSGVIIAMHFIYKFWIDGHILISLILLSIFIFLDVLELIYKEGVIPSKYINFYKWMKG